MAKKFMFVCAGILMLAGAYSFGASSVNAQAGGDFVGISSVRKVAIGQASMTKNAKRQTTYWLLPRLSLNSRIIKPNRAAIARPCQRKCSRVNPNRCQIG